MVYQGFEPYINERSKLLILGSFPSVRSRQEGFYYGNRQNKFWRILAESCGENTPESIDEKKRLLATHGIALWDTVVSCEIEGSMDKDIKNPVIADVPGLLDKYPIRHIITNGGTSYKLFERHFPELLHLCTPLPSTSPANVRLDKRVWIDALRKFL